MATRDEQSNNFLSSDALSNEFFVELVERKLSLARDEFKVRLVFISPATGKNENYLSVVYRAKINVEIIKSKQRQFVDVIVKAMLSNLPEIKAWSVFPREIFIYNDILKSFEKIWRERANEVADFGPNCLKVAEEPYEVVVLDDLKAEGYQMLNRRLGVNVEQAKLVLAKLAKFHAASVIRHEEVSTVQLILSLPPYKAHATNKNKIFKGRRNQQAPRPQEDNAAVLERLAVLRELPANDQRLPRHRC
jgi:hypothetical protein